MTPPIEDSIVRTKAEHWLVGSSYVCEVVIKVPDDALVSWQFDEKIFCIRESTASEQHSNRTDDSQSNRVHHAGTSAAVWYIGSMFVKVKAWRRGMQFECDTIRFVNKISSIPTPEIVYSWTDRDWNRSFLVLRPISGQTLYQAWESLSSDQRAHVASTVANYCKTLTSFTSNKLMTANGKGVVEPFLRERPPNTDPSWKPQLLGPYSHNDLRAYLSDNPLLADIEERFCFYHADLGPTNIMVTITGDVTGILDWESAAFYPKFWLGTKPLVSAGFFLHETNRRDWVVLLAEALEREGLPSNVEKYEEWKRAVER